MSEPSYNCPSCPSQIYYYAVGYSAPGSAADPSVVWVFPAPGVPYAYPFRKKWVDLKVCSKTSIWLDITSKKNSIKYKLKVFNLSFSNIKFLGFFSGEKDSFGIKKQVYAYPQHEPLYGTQLPFLLCSQDTNSCLYVRNLPKVYSEQICDLLTNSRPSAVLEDAQNEVVAQGLTLHHISQILRKYLQLQHENRHSIHLPYVLQPVLDCFPGTSKWTQLA